MLKRKEGSILFTTAVSAQRSSSIITDSFSVAAAALLNYARLLNKDLVQDNTCARIISIGTLVVSEEVPAAALEGTFPQEIPLIRAKVVELTATFENEERYLRRHKKMMNDAYWYPSE